nr:uncharacterized protein LOC111984759 [Quercus suber]XP_023872148.1 uncharacterized protein LOC111984759 [Quercus suber]
MPRPGPRPYECVRRAWHSDRHQPMRGSIIQQIFRVANESHSDVTKKNKEWLEKLPIVVLKAEEIMYSKANSEVEYMSSETLWDRVNDAINTIIRRDESTETGELLPPCIEAALNLGCVPVRASRSQRHTNPRSYLTPRTHEPPSAPARTTYEHRPQLSPVHSGNQLNLARATSINSARFVSESNSHVIPNANLTAPRTYPFSLESVPAGRNQLMTMESNTPLNLGTVYPLYYGTHYQTRESQLGSRVPEEPHSNTIYVGTPIRTSTSEPAEIGVLQNLFACKNSENTSRGFAQDTQEKPRERECDLSLRLGLSSHSCMNIEKSLACETEDVGSTGSQDGGKVGDLSPQTKEFCFFPRQAANDPFESSSREWNSKGEGQNSEATMRKRKAPDDGQFCWQMELPSDRFTGHIEGRGL